MPSRFGSISETHWNVSQTPHCGVDAHSVLLLGVCVEPSREPSIIERIGRSGSDELSSMMPENWWTYLTRKRERASKSIMRLMQLNAVSLAALVSA